MTSSWDAGTLQAVLPQPREKVAAFYMVEVDPKPNGEMGRERGSVLWFMGRGMCVVSE